MSVRSTRALAALLTVAATSAWAVEYGTVISSKPIVAAVPIPQQECSDQPVAYPQPTTGVGALIGGVAGAALGNAVGGGAGRALATGIGFIAGSAVGNQAEANGSPPVASTVRQCRTVTRYENRTIGFDVLYEYQGVRRHTQLAQDPGDRIALNVNVAPADAAPQPAYVAPQDVATAYPQAPRVVYAAPTYAPYYYDPYYASPWPAVAVGVGLGYRWGGWHGGWGHHR